MSWMLGRFTKQLSGEHPTHANCGILAPTSEGLRWSAKTSISLPRNVRVRLCRPMAIPATLFRPPCTVRIVENGSARPMLRMSIGIRAPWNLEMKVARDSFCPRGTVTGWMRGRVTGSAFQMRC
jgi:hypothetical protein